MVRVWRCMAVYDESMYDEGMTRVWWCMVVYDEDIARVWWCMTLADEPQVVTCIYTTAYRSICL
jgi:hypothetical protein